MAHEAVIGMGSNMGKSLQILHAAWLALHEHPDIAPLVLSSPYRSQPVGMDSNRWFINAVALVHSRLSPFNLLQVLQAIENRHGRRRSPQASGYQDRTLDLDLLLYDDRILRTPHLVLPHPRLTQRRFVLEPLCEIAADRIHPISRIPLRSLLLDGEKELFHQHVEKVSWGIAGGGPSSRE